MVTMKSVDTAKRIHKDVNQILKGLNIENQEIVLKEAHNIVESLKRIEQITSKVKT
jgi:GTP cyclohydrolase I